MCIILILAKNKCKFTLKMMFSKSIFRLFKGDQGV
jgi:hypothetical protein